MDVPAPAPLYKCGTLAMFQILWPGFFSLRHTPEGELSAKQVLFAASDVSMFVAGQALLEAHFKGGFLKHL